MACAGDIPAKEALAAVTFLRQHLPALKIRFANVVDLYRLMPSREHPHGLSDRDFDSLFTLDKPVIFNFHGYPSLIHRLTYRRANHAHIHVRGYKEKGNINTPLDLAIENQIAVQPGDGRHRPPRSRPVDLARLEIWERSGDTIRNLRRRSGTQYGTPTRAGTSRRSCGHDMELRAGRRFNRLK